MSRADLLLLVIVAVTLVGAGCGDINEPEFAYVASPRVIAHAPASPASGTITITFQLIDREVEPADVTVEYSTDGGQTYSAGTLADPAEAVSLESAWHPGVSHSIRWDSVADSVALSGDAAVRVRLTPSDASNPSGTPGVSGSFTVNNTAFNQAPTATVATPAGVQSGNVQVNYFLADVESDTCSIEVLYSTNDGTSWQAATMAPAGEGLTGLTSSPGGTAHVFLWDSRADGVAPSGQVDTIRVRVTPTDFNEGTAGETNSFSMDNSVANDPPTVSITGGPADGSTVTTTQVTFTWSGSDTDGSVIGYYYSFDNDPPDTWTTDTSATSGVLADGEHTFRVVAVDDQYDLSTTATRTFTIASPGTIDADFSGSPLTGTAPLDVSFIDLSTATNGITSWSWNFGNGDASSAQHPSCSYMNAGSYTVSLTVTGPDGTDTETKTNYITVTAPSGDTIHVDGVSGDDGKSGLDWANAVQTIQTGLDKAAGGWTVLVADGTYTGTSNKNLTFGGKAVHLRSAGGATACTIDCVYDGRGFYLDNTGEGPDSIIEGFTIQNADSCGIYCYKSSPTIADCIIKDNGGNRGAGIDCAYQASPTITGCTITGNTASDDGGGICCSGESNPVITGCTITGNTAGSGGGVYCYDSTPKFSGCTIENNTASSYGGGFYLYYWGDPTIVNCTIRANSADDGGGVYATQISCPAISNCILIENTASGDGGAFMCMYDAQPVITNCTITRNTATGSRGGALSTMATCTVTFRNSIIWGNTAGIRGHQVFTWDADDVVIFDYCDYANGAEDVVGNGTVTVLGVCKNLDPQFENPVSDFHLLSGSPCIDAGSNALVPPEAGVDPDGNARIHNLTVDMGAYEFGSSPPMLELLNLINADRADASVAPLIWMASWGAACDGHCEQVYLGREAATLVKVDTSLVTWYNNADPGKRQLMDFDGSPATGYFVKATAVAIGVDNTMAVIDSPTDFYNLLMSNFSDQLLDPAVTQFGSGFYEDVWEAMWTYNP